MVIELDSNFRIGNRVRELRLACGLSQEQLALEANITPAYLCQVERGNRNPTVASVSYTHLDVYKRQDQDRRLRQMGEGR